MCVEDVRFFVDDLGLGEDVFVESCKVFEFLKEVDGVVHRFKHFGGVRCMALVSVFLGGRRRGLPLTPFFVLDGRGFVGEKVFRRLVREFRRELGWEKCFFEAEDFVGFYLEKVLDDGFGRDKVLEVFGVSGFALRKGWRCLFESVSGLDCEEYVLSDVEVTCESFGYSGERSVEGFALYLLDVFDEEEWSGSSKVLAAASVYVAGKVI